MRKKTNISKQIREINLNELILNQDDLKLFSLINNKINHNICNKHQKELCLYCIDENELICSVCYGTCIKNNHSILSLNDYSNEISEKIKILLNKIKKEVTQNNETIEYTRAKQNKLKQKIKDLANYIKNESDLLIQKIQNSKINSLNLLNKVEIISNTKFTKILNQKEEKQKKLNKNKNKIKKMEKLEKDEKNIIKLIQESKKILSKEVEGVDEREERVLIKKENGKRKIDIEREEFDPDTNWENKIKLKTNNKLLLKIN
ncbi:tripartite motif-containing protein [Anaeramoeba flamelloides]|uniref:Tripartite motif-containing protein n=1 Tax=Anaeramoeba flamelloides TaxID=1746091 RepID=A0AAV7Z9Y7_9EUKA|nr:tripartite motif-containing protein [Anaeramoeba flamelloides]